MTLIGQQLGSFSLESKIGSGAMGEVYRATQRTKDGRKRPAAVKVIGAEFIQKDNALKRFEREAKILAQLRHPNIVRYYAHGRYKGTYYYAMEYVEGKTLDDLIEEREFLPWAEAADFGLQLCRALDYAHEHQVVHRDLKPSNLMISKSGEVKLTDFGIAKDLDATVALTRTGRTLGTAAYMAPEQIKGTPAVSHKTDLYALGCLIYQLLAGSPPFTGKSAVVLMHAHIAEPPPRPSEKNPDVPKVLDDLVVRLMAKEPPERPWDAAQVAATLEDLLERHKHGEKIPMAFDKARASVAAEEAATMAAAGVLPATSKRKAKKSGKKKRQAHIRPDGTYAPEDEAGPIPWLTRQHVETALLVLALIGLIGFAVYMAWPPSQEYLYHRAEQLMESESPADWHYAERKFLEPLERRFPDHPYQDQVEAWKDRMAVEEVQGRADALMAGHPRFSRPRNEVEQRYKETALTAETLEPLEQYGKIAGHWREFLQFLNNNDTPNLRGWQQLAEGELQRHEALRDRQREAAMELFQRAATAVQAERPALAKSLLNQLITTYTAAAEGDPAMSRLISQAESALNILDESPSDDAQEAVGDSPEADGTEERSDSAPPEEPDADSTAQASLPQAGFRTATLRTAGARRTRS